MTHLTILWLGQAISAAVYALVATLPGSAVLGNILFDTSIQTTPAIYVNAQQVLNPTASGLSFPTNGTQTGVVLQASNVTQLQTYTTACSATGGVANYAFCYVPSPFTATGTLTQVSLDCAGTALGSIVASGAIVKQTNKTTATTVANLPNFANKTYGSGSHVAFLTGSTLVNPKDAIRFQEARTSIPTTTNLNCNVRTTWYMPKGL